MQKRWDAVWYKPIDVRQYAVLRIAFGYLSAVYLLQLLPFVTAHFSGAGWLGDIQTQSVLNWGSGSLFNLPAGRYAVPYSYGLFMVGISSAIMVMIGWKTRIATFVTWVVMVSLWNRNPLLLDGDDAVLKVMLFYLLLSPCANALSVDARHSQKPQMAPVWPLRLIQFQIALIYFVSGWVKFHSTEWLDGTILQYVLSHPHYSRFNFSALFDSRFFIGLLAWVAIFIRWWELLFPVLILHRYLRRLSIFIGLLFHVGLLVFMNLRWFPIIMIALYPALLSADEFKRLLRLFRVY